MAGTPKSQPEYIDVTRYFRLTPKTNNYGRVISCDLGTPLKVEPNWGDGPFVKVTFKIDKALFKPLADIEVTLDERHLATPDVMIADLNELKKSLE